MTRTDLIRSGVVLWLIAVCGLASAAPGQDRRYQVFHHETLDAVVADADAADGQSTMRFRAHGRDFQIRLADNRRLISDLREDMRSRILSEIDIYRGELEGATDSWVRLTRRGDQWQGLIWDGYEFFVIESDPTALALSNRTASADESGPVIFRLADTDADISDIVIEVPESMRAEAAASTMDNGQQFLEMTSAATKRIDVAGIGDFEFTNAAIGDGQADIVGFMNSVDGIFDSQVDVQINLVEIRTFPQNNDPFSGTGEPIDLLNEVGSYKFSDPDLRNLGIVHLFTGVNLDGTTIGIAFLSSICSQQAGVSLSQATNVQGPVHLTAAHEIGHNFGAPHDGDSNGACGSVVGNFLMSPSLNGSDQFSQCSIDEMQQVIDFASCLSNVSQEDVQATVQVDPVSGLTGETISYAIDVESVGGSTANNVTLDIQIPAGLVVSQASFDGGSCSISPTLVSCQRATITATSIATATLDLTGAVPGAYVISATANADNDGDPSNNDASGTINLAIAADVSVDVVAADAFVLNLDNTSVTLTVSNNGPQTSSNVTASVDFGALLTIAQGQVFPSCVVSGNAQVLNCSFGDMASGAQQQFVVTVDAAASGSGVATIDAQAASNTADLDTANNTDSESVSVGARFVDVVASVSNAPGSLQTGNTGNATVTIRNDGPNSAESAMLTVAAGSGLGSIGVNSTIPCNAAGQSVTCTLSNFVGTQSIVISFVANAAGATSVQISGTATGANDFDTNSANDSVSFNLTVSDPPASSSSGGGASGLVLHGLLLLLLIRRRVV